MKSSAALFALATGAFAIGTTEFTPMGTVSPRKIPSAAADGAVGEAAHEKRPFLR